MADTRDDPHRDAPGRAPPQTAGLTPGARFGRYLALERLGEGGMGVVWAAWDERLERRVALKMLRPDVAAPGDGERLLREARAAAQLNHPHVVAVHDAGVIGGEVFLALELVSGTTLRRWLQQPRSTEELLAVFLQAGRGLAGAHHKGLVHRDFKPENVLVGADGRVRVTDFGLARPPAAPNEPAPSYEQLLGASTMRGTPAYMSPEQIRAGQADARADQFAFCVALFEAIYGEHPFAPREGGGTDALLTAIVHGQRKAPRDPSRAPPAVLAALERGLQVQPDRRWPSMDALLAALPDALEAPRRRRRRLVEGGLAALGVVVIAAAWAALDRQAHRCDPAGLAPGEGPSAAAYDARAKAWWAAAKDACEATRLRGEVSEATYALRAACLQRRRDELDALALLLPKVAPPQAAEALAALGDVAPCGDLDALTTLVPAPADPRVAALRTALARTLAQAAAGQPVEGLEALTAQAHALGWAPLEADALAQQAALAQAGGDLKAAHALGTEALLAAERGRDFDRAVDMLTLLVGAARGLGRADEAAAHARHAEALLSSRPDPTRAARLAAAKTGTGYFFKCRGCPDIDVAPKK